MALFEPALDYTLINEGGFVNNPADPGGITNLGITKKTMEAFCGHMVNVDTMKRLTKDDVRPIYRENYWDKLGLDHITDQGVATAIFDIGVNCGIWGAQKFVKNTLLAISQTDVNSCKPNEFIREIERQLEAHYQSIAMNHPTQNIFLKGWMNRARKLFTLVKA